MKIKYSIFDYITSHLKQSGCQSLSNAVRRWAVVSPDFGAIGSLQAQHLGAYFLQKSCEIRFPHIENLDILNISKAMQVYSSNGNM
jgi:hypothetical protein